MKDLVNCGGGALSDATQGTTTETYAESITSNIQSPSTKKAITLEIGGSSYIVAGMHYGIAATIDEFGVLEIQTTEANVFKKEDGVVLGALGAEISAELSYTNKKEVDDKKNILLDVSAPLYKTPYGSINGNIQTNIANNNNEISGVGLSFSTGASALSGTTATVSKSTTIYSVDLKEKNPRLFNIVKSTFDFVSRLLDLQIDYFTNKFFWWDK